MRRCESQYSFSGRLLEWIAVGNMSSIYPVARGRLGKKMREKTVKVLSFKFTLQSPTKARGVGGKCKFLVMSRYVPIVISKSKSICWICLFSHLFVTEFWMHMCNISLPFTLNFWLLKHFDSKGVMILETWKTSYPWITHMMYPLDLK